MKGSVTLVALFAAANVPLSSSVNPSEGTLFVVVVVECAANYSTNTSSLSWLVNTSTKMGNNRGLINKVSKVSILSMVSDCCVC